MEQQGYCGCRNWGVGKRPIPYFDRALEIDPRLADCVEQQRRCAVGLGRNDEAIACYDQALEIDPRDAGVWNNKGQVLSALGRNEEALTCYERRWR